MKNNKYLILTIIFGVTTILLCTYIGYDKLNSDKAPVTNSDEHITNEDDKDESTTETCSFTKTHHVVNLLDDYMGEVPESTFILVDHFQSHYPEVLNIPSTMKTSLEENKNYEFIYTIPKNNNYKTENEILSTLVGNVINEGNNIQVNNNINLIIKETDKLGLEQVNEDICR